MRPATWGARAGWEAGERPRGSWWTSLCGCDTWADGHPAPVFRRDVGGGWDSEPVTVELDDGRWPDRVVVSSLFLRRCGDVGAYEDGVLTIDVDNGHAEYHAVSTQCPFCELTKFELEEGSYDG